MAILDFHILENYNVRLNHSNYLPMTTGSPFISFNIPVGAEYRTKLLSFQHINNQIHATIEVEPEVWEHIDLIMLFNLQWNARNDGSVSGTIPVQIKMILDKALYESLHSENKLITEETAFFQSEPSHPMRSTNSWFATEVTEEVELPEGLKGSGTLREGFTTKWRDDFK